MATDIGEVFIKLIFDDKDSAAKATEAFKKFGSAAKSVGKIAAAGIAAASTAVAGLATGTIKLYSEYEQLKGGIETLFKDSSGQMMEYAKQSYKTAQISANEYMETATSFSASLIQGLGGDTKKAAEYADRAILSMADNANKMGTSMESIQNAYQGFAKQNYTMLDNLKLGYGGTKTEMERLIADASKMTDEMNELGVAVDANSTSFDNIVNAIAVVQKHLGIAGTSIDEAYGTIAGSFNMLKASWKDFVTGFSDPSADLGQLMTNLFDSINAMLTNLVPAITRALKNISSTLKTALPKLVKTLVELVKDTLPDIIQAGIEVFMSIMEYIPELTQTLLDLFFQVVNMIIPQIPTIFKAVVDGILGFLVTLAQPQNVTMLLNAAVQLLFAIIQAIPILLEALATALPDIIASLITFFTDPNNIMLLIEAGVALFMALVAAVPQILSALFAAFVNLFTSLWEKLKSVFTTFAANFGENLGNAIKGAINGVIGFLEGFLNTPIRAINGLIDTINSIPGIDIGKLSEFSLPRLAQGGITTGPTTALIGEAGKEAVIPLEQNTENWTKPLAKALADQFEEEGISTAGRITINMNNYINNNLDADEIGQRLMTSIRRAA